MKKLLSFLFVLFVLGSVYAAEPDSLLLVDNSFRNPINEENCSFKDIPLHGNVKVVVTGRAEAKREDKLRCQTQGAL